MIDLVPAGCRAADRASAAMPEPPAVLHPPPARDTAHRPRCRGARPSDRPPAAGRRPAAAPHASAGPASRLASDPGRAGAWPHAATPRRPWTRATIRSAIKLVLWPRDLAASSSRVGSRSSRASSRGQPLPTTLLGLQLLGQLIAARARHRARPRPHRSRSRPRSAPRDLVIVNVRVTARVGVQLRAVDRDHPRPTSPARSHSRST